MNQTKRILPSEPAHLEKTPDYVVAEILEAVCSIRFGVVQLTIHEGKVVQIDKTEKIRIKESGAQDSHIPHKSA